MKEALHDLLASARPETRKALEAKIRLAQREREDASNDAYFSEVKQAGRAKAISPARFHAVFETAQVASAKAARSIMQVAIEAGAADGPILVFVTKDRHRFVEAFMTSGFGHDTTDRRSEVISFCQWITSDNHRFRDELVVAREQHELTHKPATSDLSRIEQIYIDVPWLTSDLQSAAALSDLMDFLIRSARRSERDALRVFIGDARRDRLAASRAAVQGRLVQSWAAQGGEIMGDVLEAAEACARTIVAACVDAKADGRRTVAYVTADFGSFLTELGSPWPRLQDDIAKHCREHEAEVENSIIRAQAERRKQGGTVLERWKRSVEDHPVGATVILLMSVVTTLSLVEWARELLK